MNYAKLISLAIAAVQAATELAQTLRHNSGMTDDELRQQASEVDAETRDSIDKFLAGLGA